jgi:hypothetical protein
MKKIGYASYQIGEGKIGNSWCLKANTSNGYISQGISMVIYLEYPPIPQFSVYVSKDTPEYEQYVKLINSGDTDLIEDDILKKYFQTLGVSDFIEILSYVEKNAEAKGKNIARHEIRKSLGL